MGHVIATSIKSVMLTVDPKDHRSHFRTHACTEIKGGGVQSGSAANVCGGVSWTTWTKGGASGNIFAQMSMIIDLFTVLNALGKSNESRPLSSSSNLHRAARIASSQPLDSAMSICSSTCSSVKKSAILWRRSYRIDFLVNVHYNSGTPMDLMPVLVP